MTPTLSSGGLFYLKIFELCISSINIELKSIIITLKNLMACVQWVLKCTKCPVDTKICEIKGFSFTSK